MSPQPAHRAAAGIVMTQVAHENEGAPIGLRDMELVEFLRPSEGSTEDVVLRCGQLIGGLIAMATCFANTLGAHPDNAPATVMVERWLDLVSQ